MDSNSAGKHDDGGASKVLRSQGLDDSDSSSDSGTAQHCAVCYDSLQYPLKLPCNHVFCFLCIKGAYFSNQLCPMCRAFIPQNIIQNPRVTNSTTNTNTVQSPNNDDDNSLVSALTQTRQTRSSTRAPNRRSVFWCYESHRQFSTWWKYDERTSNEIEEAYQAHINNLNAPSVVNIQITGSVFCIDFPAKKQYKQNYPGRNRLIRRNTDFVQKDHIIGTAGIKSIK